MKKDSILKDLQEQRKKANKKRKGYWQKRIDDHFFGKKTNNS